MRSPILLHNQIYNNVSSHLDAKHLFFDRIAIWAIAYGKYKEYKKIILLHF